MRLFPKPLSDAEYGKIVMDYIKGIFPDAKEDEVDFRDTVVTNYGGSGKLRWKLIVCAA